MDDWLSVPPDAPDLFSRLRALKSARVSVRFGIGTAEGFRVEVPAASLALQGQLLVEPRADRFAVLVPGWGPDDFAWFARRRGRGRADYWQGAVEYRAEGRPALVLYFTAPLDGIDIRVNA